MDEAFFLRARRILGEPFGTRIDHGAFLEQVAARQADTLTARLSTRSKAATEQGEPASVTALLLAEEHWRHALQVQQGCFNRAGVRRRINTA